MFSTLVHKAATTLFAGLTVAALTLSPLPASAFDVAFSVSSGDVGFSFGAGEPIDPRAYEPGDIPQQYFDDRWDELDMQDAVHHTLVILNDGRTNDALQNEHDCLMVKKVKALLEEMRNNLAHYEKMRAYWQKEGNKARVKELDQVIDDEKADIKKWEKELRQYQRACGPQWF